MTAAQAKVLLVLTALVAAVGIATAVVFLRGDGGATRSVAQATATVAATATATPPPPAATPTSRPPANSTPTRLASLTIRPTINANVRTGPGTTFPAIGVLSVGETATATGRNIDASWLVVRIPEGEGWVASGVVDANGDPALLPLVEEATLRRPATATPTATATSTPSATPSRTPTGTPIPFPTVAARTPTTAGGAGATGGEPADLTVVDVSVGAAGRLDVVIGNLGPGAVAGRRISVLGLDDAGATLFAEVTTAISIPAGGSVNVQLAYQLTSARTLTVALNADGAVPESVTSNNRRRVNLVP